MQTHCEGEALCQKALRCHSLSSPGLLYAKIIHRHCRRNVCVCGRGRLSTASPYTKMGWMAVSVFPWKSKATQKRQVDKRKCDKVWLATCQRYLALKQITYLPKNDTKIQWRGPIYVLFLVSYLGMLAVGDVYTHPYSSKSNIFIDTWQRGHFIHACQFIFSVNARFSVSCSTKICNWLWFLYSSLHVV